MSKRRNLRITIALSVVALTAMSASSAQAANVCNEARTGHTGIYDATDNDPTTPARNQRGLAVLGSGDGLTRAAAHSPALSVCVPPGGGGGITMISPGGYAT